MGVCNYVFVCLCAILYACEPVNICSSCNRVYGVCERRSPFAIAYRDENKPVQLMFNKGLTRV